MSAKGREWDIVFLKGFNEGVLPLPARQPDPQPLVKPVNSDFREDEKSRFDDGSNKENLTVSGSVPSSSVRSNTEIRPSNHLEEERRLAYVVCFDFQPSNDVCEALREWRVVCTET